MVDPLVGTTVLLLGLVVGISGILAWRYRLSFRIAVRNIRRASTRSILVVLGLLVATAMISGSLVVGDTVRTINVHYTYVALGYTDEGIYALSANGGYAYFPQSVATAIANGSAGDTTIAGVNPEVLDRAQVFDRTTGIPQTGLNLVGADTSASAALGPFTTVSGTTLPGADPGKVLIDQRAAEQMNAAAGDSVIVYGVRALETVVQAVVQDDLRGGVLTAGLSGGNVFADLATSQYLVNATGAVNFIAVTNVGSQVEGVSLSSTVSAHLNATLAATPGAASLEVHNVLQEQLDAAETASSSTQTTFLVFGLFSIVAGAMLIVGIFAMLADERKGEMGMLRAIGLPRKAVVASYYFEGLFYAAGSAAVGTGVGILAGYGLMALYSVFVPGSVVSGSVILSSFTFTDATVVTSYLAGFLLTLATITFASFRVSQINIVRAIRDVPEPLPAMRTYTRLAYLGGLLFAAGALLFATTHRGSGDVDWPILGVAMIIVGAGLIASRFVKNRLAFSAVGAALLAWIGIEPLRNAALGSSHSSGIFVVFVMGILMIAGALLLMAFNGPALARGLERLASGRSGATPVTRLGFSYPTRRATRTSITLTIFALVLFTIVMLATFTSTVTGSLRDSIAAQSGGYTFYGQSAQPIPDFPDSVAANSTLSPLFAHVVPLVTGTGYVNVSGFSHNPYTERIFAADASMPAASNFYDTNRFPFSATLDGSSPAAVMQTLATNSSVALVDAGYSGASSFTSIAVHPAAAPGDVVRVTNPETGAARNLTVIGVLKTQILAGVWLSPMAALALGFHSEVGYLLTVPDGISTTLAAQQLKAAFFPFGLALYSFSDVLSTAIALTSGEIGLLEVFIALGLAVGIAALGILALRAVSERRHEIGTVRAIGMTRTMVLKGFLLEYTFVTLTGALIGGVLGVWLVYELAAGSGAASAGITGLYVPWLTILLVLVATGLLATIAVIGPSLRASRMAPAEAIRGVE